MSRSAQPVHFVDQSHTPGTAPLVSASQAPPGPVHAAFALWITAVAAGAFETVLAVGRLAADGSGSAAEIVGGLAVRLPVFAVALLLAVRMRRGQGWARILLTLGLGVVGMASMVVEPVRALAEGRTLGTALAEAGALDRVFGASRVVHVVAVLSALALMFLPAANRYFRLHRVHRTSVADLC